MALTYKEVAEILKIIDASECEEVVLELDGMKLVVRRGGNAGAGSPASSLSSAADQVAQSAKPTPGYSAAAVANTATPAPASEKPAAAIAEGVHVRAPMVGSFYRRPAPDHPPFVEKGARVSEGDPLCLIEVMKLYTTIAAPVAGTVRQIAVEDAQLVEFDQVLFVIEPD